LGGGGNFITFVRNKKIHIHSTKLRFAPTERSDKSKRVAHRHSTPLPLLPAPLLLLQHHRRAVTGRAEKRLASQAVPAGMLASRISGQAWFTLLARKTFKLKIKFNEYNLNAIY